MGLLKFKEGYVERMWGGDKLRTVYGKKTPSRAPVGEAWLIADHREHESVLADGAESGRTLRDLLVEDAAAILGTRARLTMHGRFPLLLKLLDAGDKLSIQVHPDDADAKRLKEPDVGKTEMWYVLQADADSELYCGMSPKITREAFEQALDAGEVASVLTTFPAREGTAVYVAAGTVHAIGGGSLLAEIQQNSDITYRVDDWGRVQPDGTPRELHVDKALEVAHFGSRHAGAARPIGYDTKDAHVSVLAACRYFAAELVRVDGTFTRDTGGETFHLLLGKSGTPTVSAGETAYELAPGSALIAKGSESSFTIEGEAEVLDYYVPDLERDVARPLTEAGHRREAIIALGGDPSTSDISA